MLTAMVAQLSMPVQAGLALVCYGFMVPWGCCEGAVGHALLRELEKAADTATAWTRSVRKLMYKAIDLAPP